MREGFSRAWLGLNALCALHALHGVARAQSAVDGPWQAGATTVEVSIKSWGKDCGPKPEPMRSAGGGTVRVEQQGERLIVHGQDRTLYSDRCASPNPAVRRVSSGRIGNTWTTRCRTDAQDPRQEAATYTLELLAPNQLRYRDLSHFDWRLHASTCAATITTTQLLQRSVATGTPLAVPSSARPASDTAASTPPATPAPSATGTPPCVPGAATRLSLRPSKLELALGQRACFEVRLVDAKGCALPDSGVRLNLEHGPGIRARLDGRCFRAAESSAEGEGSFRVLASAGGLRADAQVIVSAEQLPSLIAARVQSSAIEGVPDPEAAPIAAPAAPPKPLAQAQASRVAARAAQDAKPAGHRLLLLSLALLLVLAAVAFVLRRERVRATPTPAPALARSAKPTPAQRPRAAASASAPKPSAPGAPAPETPAVTANPDRLRCPRCGTRYPQGNAFCGVDGERLVPEP